MKKFYEIFLNAVVGIIFSIIIGYKYKSLDAINQYMKDGTIYVPENFYIWFSIGVVIVVIRSIQIMLRR
jgi:hypothetical protein